MSVCDFWLSLDITTAATVFVAVAVAVFFFFFVDVVVSLMSFLLCGIGFLLRWIQRQKNTHISVYKTFVVNDKQPFGCCLAA